MQQNCIETLQSDRELLIQELSLIIIIIIKIKLLLLLLLLLLSSLLFRSLTVFLHYYAPLIHLQHMALYKCVSDFDLI